MKDGQLFHILTYGGQAGMPNFAAQLSPEARWDVINYVRSMRPPSEIAAAETDSANDGQNQSEETSAVSTSVEQPDSNAQEKQEQP